ncbi:hypothetical protein EMIHUDRAFT_445271 [Emiliania huxleyi CCMP1516]|uniref:Uncharacterized protein n=2 Tax=Emiliania huxleyi TaxID=2903 RepID=A0A0D3J101_EMIH1|nr:hypothetical protein EMIHUDRAFT_445271 [Emiliania huxleyi CCMP1516]EOD17186.1 hypothetical protein EMIHUDRAFT_445271 [Emiliania huxleyi CCMP1516]|eukprot:XP_005769615.1 hypothetical protein EMIHUDRAFT_445271 [Emiliania huxleyi CCMP1516]
MRACAGRLPSRAVRRQGSSLFVRFVYHGAVPVPLPVGESVSLFESQSSVNGSMASHALSVWRAGGGRDRGAGRAVSTFIFG